MLRIVSAVALVAVLVAGCGGSSRSPDGTAARGVPRALASQWARQASAVADAAAAGDNCRALHLAAALRTEVITKRSQVPSRLQSPLLAGVNALADRIVCQAPPQTVTVPTAKPPKHQAHDDHHDRHRKHGDGGQGEGG